MKTLLKTILAISLLVGCASNVYRYQFFIAPEVTSRSIRNIAIAPFNILPCEDNIAYPIPESIEDSIAASFSAHNYNVISSKLFSLYWQGAIDSLGGMFDSKSGALDRAKYLACIKKTTDILKSKNKIDAIIFPHLACRSAHLSGRAGVWDGVWRQISVKNYSAAEEIRWSGNMKALSLHVIIISSDDVKLFENYAGIELLTEVDYLTGEGISAQRANILGDLEWNMEAIRLCFEPFFKNDIPTPKANN